MDSAEETQDRRAVSDLKGFDKGEEVCSVFLREDHAVARGGVVEFPREIHGGDGGCEVGKRASETHVVCFARDFSEGESFFDCALVFVRIHNQKTSSILRRENFVYIPHHASTPPPYPPHSAAARCPPPKT